MAIPIYLRRGLAANVAGASASDGEPLWTTDTHTLWVSQGGVKYQIGGGSVTSVGLSLPSIFSVTGSPVTTSGTLTGALAAQGANQVFAGPASGGAALPTFRAIATADIPLFNGLASGDVGLTDAVPEYNATAGQNRTVTVDRLGGFVNPAICEGRLTLATGTPVPTTDVTSAATIYFTPYRGNRVAAYDGTRWRLYVLTEISLGLVTASGKPYDVFLYDNSGVLTLEILAWTSGTARATALGMQDGVPVKSSDTTRRYLGTFYTTALNRTEDSLTNRLLWNYNNRVKRPLRRNDTTSSWTYGTNAWRAANNSLANSVTVVVGVQDALLDLDVRGLTNVAAAGAGGISIGEDSSTTEDPNAFGEYAMNASVAVTAIAGAKLVKYPAIGFHTYYWIESALGANTFYGKTAGASGWHSGLSGWLEG